MTCDFRLLPSKDKLPRNFHPWVFSGALESRSAINGPGAPQDDGRHDSPPSKEDVLPSVVSLADHRNDFVAWAQLNHGSGIRLRLVSWKENERPGPRWLEDMLRVSIMRRAPLARDTNALRLVFSESDGLPGVIVDRIGQWLNVQLDTSGADTWRTALRSALPKLVKDLLPGIEGIFERSDGDGRDLENMPPHRELWWGTAPPDRVDICEHGITLSVRPGGQKTGYYADQRENRTIVARYAAGCRMLDVCSYTGGFSAHAFASGALHSTLVDSSKDALSMAKDNLPGRDIQTIEGDAFKVLRELQGKETYDLIVLDPPKLAPKRAGLERALHAYKDLNLQAIKLLAPGGLLASFSCSGLVTATDLRQTITFAAKDAGRRMHILHHMSQGPDHPVPLSFPEAEYLKGFLLRAH